MTGENESNDIFELISDYDIAHYILPYQKKLKKGEILEKQKFKEILKKEVPLTGWDIFSRVVKISLMIVLLAAFIFPMYFDVLNVIQTSNNYSKILKISLATRFELFLYFAFIIAILLISVGFYLYYSKFFNLFSSGRITYRKYLQDKELYEDLITEKHQEKFLNSVEKPEHLHSVKDYWNLDFVFRSSAETKAYFLAFPFLLVSLIVFIYLLIVNFQFTWSLVGTLLAFFLFFILMFYNTYKGKSVRYFHWLIKFIQEVSYSLILIQYALSAIYPLPGVEYHIYMQNFMSWLNAGYFFLVLGFFNMSIISLIYFSGEVLRKIYQKRIIREHFLDKQKKVERKFQQKHMFKWLFVNKKIEENKERSIWPIKIKKYISSLSGISTVISSISGFLTFIEFPLL